MGTYIIERYGAEFCPIFTPHLPKIKTARLRNKRKKYLYLDVLTLAIQTLTTLHQPVIFCIVTSQISYDRIKPLKLVV